MRFQLFPLIAASSVFWIGVRDLAAQALCDVRNGTQSFVSEQRFNYCGIASTMMLEQQARNYVYPSTSVLARQDEIAAGIRYCVRNGELPWCSLVSGVTIPDLEQAAFDATPNGWVYGEWVYGENHEAMKGTTYAFAQYNHPVVLSGKTVAATVGGGHYYLLNGYQAQNATGGPCSPYWGYPKTSIKGIYILDPLWTSPAYTNYKEKKALPPNSLIINLDQFFQERWTRTGSDQKYRSVEKGCASCWSYQGSSNPNNTIRTSY